MARAQRPRATHCDTCHTRLQWIQPPHGRPSCVCKKSCPRQRVRDYKQRWLAAHKSTPHVAPSIHALDPETIAIPAPGECARCGEREYVDAQSLLDFAGRRALYRCRHGHRRLVDFTTFAPSPA